MINVLFKEPFTFKFFQAVRLLELGTNKPGTIGRFDSPTQEVVRFAANTTLSFPASEIQSLDRVRTKDGAERPPLMTINLMGLTGPHGILPLVYTIEVLRTKLAVQRPLAPAAVPRRAAAAAFFDIFNHRLISLFYRGWKKHRLAINYEDTYGGIQRLGAASVRNDPVTLLLRALIGLGTPALRDRQDIPDRFFLFYAGLLARRPRSAAALEQVVAEAFGIDVVVEQFAGGWCRPSNAKTNLRGELLGKETMLGEQVWAPCTMVRLIIGPLRLSHYTQFLPGNILFRRLKALIKFFTGTELASEVRLILMRQEVPLCRLGCAGESAPRLGQLAWAIRGEAKHDLGTVFAL